ncbi:MAG TPA: TauD/TfdA family dioxygenase [Acidimicrobiales bacterium]
MSTTTPEARPLSTALGAEVTGLDISRRLDDDEVKFLRQVFDERGLVLFRNVDIPRLRQAYLSQLLMVADAVPTEDEAAAIADQQASFLISNREEGAAGPFGRLLYHCDGMWSEWPYEVISLFAVAVEKPVVPTWYVSSANGWTTLPDDLRASVEGLRVEQVAGPEYVHERRQKGYEGELVQAKRDYVPSYETPVVYTHPRTGQPLLFVTEGMTRGVVGMDPDASEDLLEPIFAHLYAEENRLEFEWEPGDLVLWDNLSIQHGRPYVALEGPARTLRKIGLPMPEEAIAASLVDTYEEVETVS